MTITNDTEVIFFVFTPVPKRIVYTVSELRDRYGFAIGDEYDFKYMNRLARDIGKELVGAEFYEKFKDNFVVDYNIRS